MRLPYILSLSTLISGPCIPLCAQEAQWLHAEPMDWSFNAEMPSHLIRSSHNGHVFVARNMGNAFSYGVDAFGQYRVEAVDPANGAPLGGCTLTDSVVVESMAVSEDGIGYFAGRFIGNMQLCDGETMSVNAGFLDTHLFMLAMDASGIILWARDMSSAHPNAQRIPALALDNAGTIWCGIEEFEVLHLVSMDGQGNESVTRTISGTRSLGGFAFDPADNVFVTGSTGNSEGPLVFGGANAQVPESYMMFVLRMNANGSGDWARLAHDVTFQDPDVVTDPFGNAYVSGELMDSTSFGDIAFNGPNWVYDVFLTKVDADGNFLWGRESAPEGGGLIAGDLFRSRGPGVTSDAAGHVYLTANLRGSVDWGNGVVCDGGSPTDGSQTFVAFNGDGTPQWEITSDPAVNFLTAQTITCDDAGTIWFASHVSGEFDLQGLAANQGGEQAFIDGRIGITALAIPEVQRSIDLLVFPLPAANELNVQLPGPHAEVVELINTNGQRVAQFTASPGVNKIDVHTLRAGVYLLRTSGGEAVRWVKQ